MNDDPRAATSSRHPRPKRRATDGRLAELLLLPIAMGGLSLLMWFSLPTFNEALTARGKAVDEIGDRILRMARSIPVGARTSHASCGHTLDPRPVRLRDGAGGTNTEIVEPRDLQEMDDDAALASDLNLYLRGPLTLLIYWRTHPPLTAQRMSRKRIAREIERPLGFAYLVLYDIRLLTPVARGPDERARGTARVNAFLFDLASGERLCELGFTQDLAPGFRAGEPFEEHASWELAVSTKQRLLAELARITGGTFQD
jgi:hypothetical protein